MFFRLVPWEAEDRHKPGLVVIAFLPLLDASLTASMLLPLDRGGGAGNHLLATGYLCLAIWLVKHPVLLTFVMVLAGDWL